MADYYPLIARAVAGLEKNTGETRRALYERARTALLAQLRGVSPALDEADITRERLGLEEAIRKVEMESARKARETPPPPPPARASAGKSASSPEIKNETPATPEGKPDEQRPAAKAPPVSAPPSPPSPAPRDGATSSDAARPARPSLTDQGLKGFRDVFGDNKDAPAAKDMPAAKDTSAKPRTPPPPQPRQAPPPRPTPPARDPLAGHTLAHDLDQLEPRIHEEALRGLPGDPPRPENLSRPPMPPRPRTFEEKQRPERAERRSGSAVGKIIIIALLLLIAAGVAGVGYWQRNTIMGFYQSLRSQPAPATRDAANAPTRPKIADRVGGGQANAPGAQTNAPAVAQRVVLYEEDPANPDGKRYSGSAIWRTEMLPGEGGQASELAVRADVEIPERKIALSFTIRRNTDKTLPASHTVEILFNLPPDFPSGGIQNVPGVLMKQAEAARGAPLAGLGVKVTPGFFLIGLSAVESDYQRNIELLKERSWFDIPIVYTNNRRAILAIEKGTPGERAFAEAFAAWKQ